eukprot:GHRR01022253.1.p1 GENE.GHRR01022253.1~~GHRR01022253.1.p1  ORF type:complete len:124 (+),score=36.51 GHRR01022253.1:401-772(+)
MAFEGFSSQALRRPEAASSTNVSPGTFAWATVHQYNAADTGQIKAACLHEDVLYISSRKGIWQINSATGRYEEFQRATAAQPLVHNVCAITNTNGPVLWACTGTDICSTYSLQDKTTVRRVNT